MGEVLWDSVSKLTGQRWNFKITTVIIYILFIFRKKENLSFQSISLYFISMSVTSSVKCRRPLDTSDKEDIDTRLTFQLKRKFDLSKDYFDYIIRLTRCFSFAVYFRLS